jgi:hypothetical protein
MRPRVAPRAVLTAISPLRIATRTNSSSATFAHMSSRKNHARRLVDKADTEEKSMKACA